MIVNVFVRALDGRTSCFQFITGEARVRDLRASCSNAFGIPKEEQRLIGRIKRVTTDFYITDDDDEETEAEAEDDDDAVLEANQSFDLSLRLLGGKGGFGTLLRTTGKKKNAGPQNNDLCRDLRGQRYHVVANEKKLQKWEEDEQLRMQEQKAIEYIESEYGAKAEKKRELERAEQRFREDSEIVKKNVEDAMKAIEQQKRVLKEIEEENNLRKRKSKSKSGASCSSSSSLSAESDDDDDDDFRRKKKAQKQTTQAVAAIGVESNEEKEQQEEEEEEKIVVVRVDAAVAPPPPPPEKTFVFDEINLENIESAKQLELFGLDHLKIELTRRQLKCGGNLEERASRLFLLKSTAWENIDKKFKMKKF
jgi:hypothetical protein